MNNVIEFVRHGGVMMYPLLISSIVLISIIVERAIVLKKNTADPEELLDDVRAAFQPGGDPTAAIAAVEKRGAIGRIFARGLRNSDKPADAIEMAIEQEAAFESGPLEANLPIVKTIVNISPLLGLLGTIAGMIASFQAASRTGLSNPTEILGGISEALISTATGITLAVIGFIAYNYFANVVRKVFQDIELYGAELVNYMTGRLD